jgi:dolichol-phosphate mannosyltransferase
MERLMEALRSTEAHFADTHVVRVLLIDDGSTDDTAGVAQRWATGHGFDRALSVLRHPANRGPGAAFATAFESLAATLKPTDAVLTIEGDNTSRLELVAQMVTRSREGFDVVLASPYLYGGAIVKTSFFRMLISHLANGVIKGTLGLRGIATMSSFFRLHRGSLILRLQRAYGPRIVERPGFESMIEMLLKISYLRASVSEVAMTLDTSQRSGKSKMRVVKTAWGYCTLAWDKGRWWKCVKEAERR